MEAANTVALNHQRQPQRHVSQRYGQLKERKGHPKAIGAVARHLSEASFPVLSKQEDYCDPALRPGRVNAVFCDGHVESPKAAFVFEDWSDVALVRWNRDHQPHQEQLPLSVPFGLLKAN